MAEKRYYQRDFEELYYIIDSHKISKKEFDEKEMYDGYTAFEDSMTGEEIVDLLNENDRLKQFQTNTFTLINEMIETANLYRKPIHTFDYGDDLGYWNGVYQKLKELRDILENEEARR